MEDKETYPIETVVKACRICCYLEEMYQLFSNNPKKIYDNDEVMSVVEDLQEYRNLPVKIREKLEAEPPYMAECVSNLEAKLSRIHGIKLIQQNA